MNMKKKVKFDLDRLVLNIASGGYNEDSHNTDRNRIKGYKDIL